jgi:hypothetical protein
VRPAHDPAQAKGAAVSIIDFADFAGTF